MNGSVDYPVPYNYVPGKEAYRLSIVNADKILDKLIGIAGEVFCHENAGKAQEVFPEAAAV